MEGSISYPHEMDEVQNLKRRVGHSLRAARLKVNLNQEQAAKLANKSREYWAHVESSGRNLTLETIAALAAAVGSNVRAIIMEATGSKRIVDKPGPRRKVRNKRK